MYVLGIESSCDETAASIVKNDKTILSNVIYSQIKEHSAFGGIVPEIAARAHLEKIDVVVAKAFSDANLSINDIDAVAGTCGPGLIGGVIVGATFAKGISIASNIPFIAVNHIEAHALSVRITNDVEFPYLLLLISGGHCQSCIVHAVNKFEIIGRTLDDSIGEAFDKVAKLLGYGYPGGKLIENQSVLGNIKRFSFPKPMCSNNSLDFSFSGLKTAVKIAFEQSQKLQQDKDDICACFQATVTAIMKYKADAAIKHCKELGISVQTIVAAGGVAANTPIRQILQNLSSDYDMQFIAPPIDLCTDNAAMIAWNGIERLRLDLTNEIDFSPRPSWPLESSATENSKIIAPPIVKLYS